MGISINEERFEEVRIHAKHIRMRQLESDFADWDEYVERVEEKNSIMRSLEAMLSGRSCELLRDYDDAYSIMVCKAQDYFYDQGFKDCLSLIRMVLGETKIPKAPQPSKNHRVNPAEAIMYP